MLRFGGGEGAENVDQIRGGKREMNKPSLRAVGGMD